MGQLELIVGCVFAGKTQELIRRVNRSRVVYDKQGEVLLFKASIDDRYSDTDVTSHDLGSLPAIPVESTKDIYASLAAQDGKLQVVGIDELQFFDAAILDACADLVNEGVTVIASGLNKDFRGEPFPLRESGTDITNFVPSGLTMADFFGIVDDTTTLTAICDHYDNGTICRQDAYFTQRFLKGTPAPYTDPLIVVGNKQESNDRSYSARCRTHHEVQSNLS